MPPFKKEKNVWNATSPGQNNTIINMLGVELRCGNHCKQPISTEATCLSVLSLVTACKIQNSNQTTPHFNKRKGRLKCYKSGTKQCNNQYVRCVINKGLGLTGWTIYRLSCLHYICKIQIVLCFPIATNCKLGLLKKGKVGLNLRFSFNIIP